MAKCPCHDYGVDGCNHTSWLQVFEEDFPLFFGEQPGQEEERMVTRIRVSKETIKRNVEEGRHVPAVYVKTGPDVVWCHEAIIDGPSRVVHNKNHVWIETTAQVETIVHATREDAPVFEEETV